MTVMAWIGFVMGRHRAIQVKRDMQPPILNVCYYYRVPVPKG